MWVYIILYILTITFCVLETNVAAIIVKRKCLKMSDITFIVLSAYILLLGILRGELLGIDSANYKDAWNVYRHMGFYEALMKDSDFGYGLLNWIVSRFVSEFWGFRAILFSITFLSVAIWIKKHSCNVAMSFFIYISTGCLSFDFTILRQALAVSIFVWSYDFIIERKPFRFVMILALAATCHRTALFMVIVYPLLISKIRNGKFWVRFACFSGTAIMALTVGKWVGFLYPRTDYTQIINSGGGILLLIYYAVLFWILYLLKRRGCCDEAVDSEYQLALSLIFIQIIATAVSIATRMLKYSITYLFLLVPGIMDGQDRKTKNAVMIFSIGFLSVLYIREFWDWQIVPYITWF